MTIEYLDPRSEPGLPVDPYGLKADLSVPGTVIGLLANGFPDSATFLHETGITLKERLPEIKIRPFDKGNASIVAGDTLLDAIAAECHAVITACGH